MTATNITVNYRPPLAERFPVEFDYFESHEEDLKRDFPSQHIVIRGTKVVANYETAEELMKAVEEGLLEQPALVCYTDTTPIVNPYVQVVESA